MKSPIIVICAVVGLVLFLFPALTPAKAFAVDSITSHGNYPQNAQNISLPHVLKSPYHQEPPILRREFDPAKYADDNLWKRYVAKGEHLLCAMRATDKGAGFLLEDTRTPKSATSPWSGNLIDELREWFWHIDWQDPDDCDWKRQKLEGTFEGLGLNWRPTLNDDGEPVKNGANSCHRINHYNVDDVEDPNADWPQMKKPIDQKYKVDKTWYSATGGYYIFSINVRDGAIIGINLESPFSATTRYDGWGRKPELTELPALRHCSDIYMGYWVRDNPNVQNLRIYGAHNVVNTDTTLLTVRAFRNKNIAGPTEWPGHTFETNTDEGKALLGSPIGSTIANMLIRNKAILGIKHVVKVTVVTNDRLGRQFGSNYHPDFHLFFHIENVPADDIPQDKAPGDKASHKRNEKRVRRAVGRGGKRVFTSEGNNTVLRLHQFDI